MTGLVVAGAGGVYLGNMGFRPSLDRVYDRQERAAERSEVVVDPFAPPPRMLVFGAIGFAAVVVRTGKFLRYYVTVCDARKLFGTALRFPDADEVVVDWPHRFLARTDVDTRRSPPS
jgi:xanthine dehydrogenase accessory factor